MQQSNISLN